MEIDKIYNQDCLVGMQSIPDSSIDAIICDLPYGTTKNKWDVVIPLDQLWAAYRRIIKPNGAIVLFAQTPFDKVLGASNLEWLKYEWIWQKTNSTGFLNANYAPMKVHENILVFSPAKASPSAKVKMTYNPQYWQSKPYTNFSNTNSKNYSKVKRTKTVSDGRRFPIDVLSFPSERKTIHPTQKPLSLLRYLVSTYTNVGDIVLDSCFGSGTTILAAIMENRHYLGYELNKEYFDIATTRIQKLTKQNTLML